MKKAILVFLAAILVLACLPILPEVSSEAKRVDNISVNFVVNPSPAVVDRRSFFSVAIKNSTTSLPVEDVRYRFELLSGTSSIFTTGGLSKSGSFIVEYMFQKVGKYVVNITIFSIGLKLLEPELSTDFEVEAVEKASGVLMFTVLDTVTADSRGMPTAAFEKGSTVIVTSRLVNNDATRRSFIYIVQIKDSLQHVVSIGFVIGSISPGDIQSLGHGVTLSEPNVYTAEVYIWNSLDEATPLAPPILLEFKVV